VSLRDSTPCGVIHHPDNNVRSQVLVTKNFVKFALGEKFYEKFSESCNEQLQLFDYARNFSTGSNYTNLSHYDNSLGIKKQSFRQLHMATEIHDIKRIVIIHSVL